MSSHGILASWGSKLDSLPLALRTPYQLNSWLGRRASVDSMCVVFIDEEPFSFDLRQSSSFTAAEPESSLVQVHTDAATLLALDSGSISPQDAFKQQLVLITGSITIVSHLVQLLWDSP